MKPFTKIAAIALATTLALPAFAAPETFNLDANHTFTSFSYSHFGYSIQQSRFDKTSGSITLDRAAKTGSADITIDVKSVSTGSELFNGHIKAEGYFDVEKFPTATYKSTAFKFDGDKLASIDGNLTLKGVTKPVTLTVTNFHCMPHPMAKKDACGANATAKVKRTDFNLGKNVPYVGDEVTITVAIEAVKS